MCDDCTIDSKIEEMIANLNDYYSKSMKEGVALKTRIDTIEENIANGVKNEEKIKQIALTSDRLDKLVDSLMLTNGKLHDLKDSCVRIEDLMTSLLCYSLSRFRDKKV